MKVKRSDGLWRFACGDVLNINYNNLTVVSETPSWADGCRIKWPGMRFWVFLEYQILKYSNTKIGLSCKWNARLGGRVSYQVTWQGRVSNSIKMPLWYPPRGPSRGSNILYHKYVFILIFIEMCQILRRLCDLLGSLISIALNMFWSLIKKKKNNCLICSLESLSAFAWL